MAAMISRTLPSLDENILGFSGATQSEGLGNLVGIGEKIRFKAALMRSVASLREWLSR
jgi:hypothetical protein